MADDIETRVARLEEQIDILRRGLALTLASVGPGMEWLKSSLKQEQKR